MPLILYECASPRFHHTPPNWIPMIKVTFKFISALKQWLVCTIFFAIIPLHVRTHSSKNYLLIFLHVFILIFLITLPTNTLRMKNQFIQLIHLSLNSTLMIRLTFLKYFIPYFVFFYATPNFTTRTGTGRYKKGRRPRTTGDLYLPLAGYSNSQKPPLLARAFTRFFHSSADHSSICRRNSRRSKKV